MTAAQKQKMDMQDKVVEDCGIIQFQLKMTKSLVQQFPDLTAETFVLKDLFVFFREGTRNECQNRRFIRFGKRRLELFLQPSAGRIDKAGQKRRG